MKKRSNITTWFEHILDIIGEQDWKDLDLLIEFYSDQPSHDFNIAWQAIVNFE